MSEPVAAAAVSEAANSAPQAERSGGAGAGPFRGLKSSHELFPAAVRNALPSMRFLPAEVGGRKVKQLVQQPFTFAIAK